jgi:HlyD family secretion protein
VKKILKPAGTLLVVAAIVAAIAYALRPQPAQVDIQEVVRGPMRTTIDEEGETRIRERFVVSSPVSGRVLRIDLEPGDPVRAGQTMIATVLPADPTPLDARTRAEATARVDQAEAALRRTEASRSQIAEEFDFADTQLRRYEELVEDGLVPREQFDTVRADARRLREALNTAEFDVQNAERAVDVARAALVESGTAVAGDPPVTVRSPIDGVVLRRLRESEAVVPMGEPLVEIGDTGELEIVSDLLSADAVRIDPGDRVLIEEWGGGATLEGRVRRIEPSGFTKLSALGVEEQRVNVIIDFLDREEAGRQLGDAYRVEIRIVTWETDDTLKAPTSSLFRDQNNAWAVFAVVDGVAEERSVEIGQRNGVEAQVLSGLMEGDLVIAHPGDLSSGVEVVQQ